MLEVLGRGGEYMRGKEWPEDTTNGAYTKRHDRLFWDMNMFTIVNMEVGSWVYTCVKMYQIVHLCKCSYCVWVILP